MSARSFPADILFEQRLLSCAGFYAGALDGKYGPATRAAEAASNAAFETIKASDGAFDPRSEMNIVTLLPAMQKKARAILHVARDFDPTLHVAILSGTRTYAEQNALFEKNPKVTNARGGQSNHNFGIAMDIGIFKGAEYLTEEKPYVDFAALVKARVAGVEWGGGWPKFRDTPHYQLALALNLDQVRAHFNAGKPFT